MRRAGLPMQKKRNRHIPMPLPRQAPIGARAHHRRESRPPPSGIKLGLLDRGQRRFAQRREPRRRFVHRHKPLPRGAKNHRRFVPPTNRIIVAIILDREQGVFLPQQIDDGGNRLPHRNARAHRRVGDESAFFVDRAVDGQSVRRADSEIVFAVRGRGVDDSGAGFERDMIGAQNRRRARQKRMRKRQSGQRLAARGSDDAGGGGIDSPTRKARSGEIGGDNQAPARGFDEGVIEIAAHAQRAVGGQSPSRRRPRDGENRRFARVRRQAESAQAGGFVAGGEHRVDGARDALFVFDFGFGQSRRAIGAPQHRLARALDEAAREHRPESAHDSRLDFEVHRAIGIRPIRQRAHADETLALFGDLLFGESAAAAAKRGRVVAAKAGFFDLVLDRQAVAIPARAVRRVEAGHCFAAHDEVLQDFVDRVADMRIAVGVRRAFVQKKARAAAAFFAQAIVKARFLPAREDFRLAPRELSAHRESRARQIERVAVFVFFGHWQNR